jgi:ABC-type transporter Mla subunit MlaD
MRESTQNFLVGLTSIVAVVGICYLLMQFGELDHWIHKRYRLTIRTDHAAGLRPGSVVEYNGVPIGFVDDVMIDSAPTSDLSVIIDALIDLDQQVPVSVVPYSVTSLFGGSATLELATASSAVVPSQGVLSDVSSTSYFPKDGSATISEPIRLQMIEQLTAELDSRMQPVIDALDSFKELSATYTEVGRNINDLIAGADGAGVDWRKTVRNFNDVLAQVNEALQLAKQWLGDEALRADVRGAVAKANDLIQNATETLDRYTRLADELEANADEVVKGLMPITDEVSRTLEEVRRVARLAVEGQGTVAQLLNNPDLYRSLDDAAIRLERTLVEIQLYIQKVKAEGVDIKF